jgi:DinB family protein
MSKRTEALAVRLEEGARALVALARTLTDAEWQTPTKDGRKIGVVVHHVGNMYPLEIQLALTLAKGEAIAGVSWDDVHAVNARHAKDFDKVTKEEAVHFVELQSAAAAEAIRQLTDDQLDLAAPVSLNADAPLTTQFFIEDHALRHSYYHTMRIKEALKAAGRSAVKVA